MPIQALLGAVVDLSSQPQAFRGPLVSQRKEGPHMAMGQNPGGKNQKKSLPKDNSGVGTIPKKAP